MDAMPANMQSLLNPPVIERKAHDVPGIRAIAIRDAAMAVGARVCLATRSKQIENETERMSSDLDKMFNFAPLAAGNMLPPVVSEQRDRVTTDGGKILRIADRVYRIEKPAVLFATLPSWRTYLFDGLDPSDNVEAPSPGVLPRSTEEQAIWKKAAMAGCDAGRGQADAAFKLNMNRLTADYEGMVRFSTLAAKQMAYKPTVAKSGEPVTGNGNEIAVNDQTERIVAGAELSLKSGQWKSGGMPDSNQAGKPILERAP